MDAFVEPSKTRRLYLLLRDRIVSGALTAGARLPSEPDLAATHGVSRVTVRRALDGLEQDGLVRRQPGAGTFVTAPRGEKTIVGDLANMLAHLVEMGRTTTVRLLSFAYVEPVEAVREGLRLAKGERAQRSVRVRFVDGAAFSYLVTHVPERIGVTYSESDLATTPLLVLLERSGVEVERARQSITATLAGPDMAQALGVEVGAPLLALTRVVLDGDGMGVEHLQAFYRPDRYAYQMELTRTGAEGSRRWRPLEAASGDGHAANAG